MEIKEIKICDIKPDPNQPRKKIGFSDEEIRELADSIKSVGIIVPLLIQKDNILVDGERRLRAAKSIGLKEVPVVYNENLTGLHRLEYQLICSLNSTSCAEEEIAPKIKEYIDESGYSNVVAATRLGKTEGYIRLMINQLSALTKEEKDIIKLWRETKGKKGIAPSNVAELKQTHPEKEDEIIKQAKEEVVCRSDLRRIAKEKRLQVILKEEEEYKGNKKERKITELISKVSDEFNRSFNNLEKVIMLINQLAKHGIFENYPEQEYKKFEKVLEENIEKIEELANKLNESKEVIFK